MPGTFSYSPAIGTILGAGNGETLSVTFTPTDSTDYISASGSATINVSQVAPTITWSNPASIVYGTVLSTTQLDATANVPGTFTYTPAIGTILAAGTDRLTETFTPADATDYKSVSATVELTVSTPSPSPTPSMITGQQPVFQRKTNKKGKPVGKAALSGFTLQFGTPLDPSAAANAANYQVDTITTRKLKKKVEDVLHPITKFTVSYSLAGEAVTIAFGSPETFPTGGQITVLNGVTSASGGAFGGPTVFTISKGGRSIAPG